MTTPAVTSRATTPRVLAHVRSEASGPMLIVIGGLHGNEPAGPAAMRDVVTALAPGRITVRGDLVLVAGNVSALDRGTRFVDRDLNRGWTSERLAALRAAASAPATSEDREQLELADALERAFAAARGPVHLLDLHTTSAAGIPFAMCRDSAAARRFAGAVPCTLVLGLLDALDGTLASHYGDRCLAVAFEGGQNTDPASERNHAATIWLALVAAGLVEEPHVPDLPRYREMLERTRGDLPPALHVRHRHAITADDRFRMEPGYANIQRIGANELLAHDRRGEIRAGEPGFVLMPLYQAMGDDGFFLAREAGEPRE